MIQSMVIDKDGTNTIIVTTFSCKTQRGVRSTSLFFAYLRTQSAHSQMFNNLLQLSSKKQELRVEGGGVYYDAPKECRVTCEAAKREQEKKVFREKTS